MSVGHTSQICEALQIEINERYRTASSTPQPQDHDIRSWEESKGPVQQSQEAQTSTSHLVNLDLVIQLMFLSAVSQSIHAQLGIRSKRIFLDCPLSLHFPLFSWIDTDNSSCDDITFTTKKRHPTLAKQPQCTEFQVCLEFRLDPSTLGIHSYFALFQNCSTAPVKLATNHFISSAQSVVPLLYPKIISSRHLSSHMYDWDSLPLDTILADIRKCTPVESLRHFGAQYRLLKQSDSILSIPGEMTFYSHHFHVEGYQLHVMLSYSRACFVVAPSQRYPAEYTLENFTSLFAKLSDDHKVLLFSDRIHQLSVAVAEDNCICYLSESFDSSQPCLLGLPLLYVSHFLSQLEAWDYWIKSSHRKLSYIAAIPSSSEAFFTLTFLPTCFCVVPLQSPIVFSPLSLFSIDYSSALPDLVGCSSMSLYSRYILDVVGLGLQDVVISSSLSPHEYLTTISTLISPLITLFTSLLQHYSRIRSSIVVDNYSLWSLDDLMLEFIRGGHRYTVFIKIAIAQASPQSTELMCDCTLDDQTSEKISLSNLPDILEELISKSTPK